MKKNALLLALTCVACHSEELPPTSVQDAGTSVESTKIIASEMTDAAVPPCSVHLVSDAFSAARGAPAGSVRVEGDFTRTLANITVTPVGAPVWIGSFTGPRDSFGDVVKPHLCTRATVYALKTDGNKDPNKGPVVMNAFAMTPDEKSDIDAICNAYTRAASDAGEAQLRDRAAMQWVEDQLTTPRWDLWRRRFATELGEAYAHKNDTKDIFTRRAGEIESAASALGLKCDTATQWKKR